MDIGTLKDDYWGEDYECQPCEMEVNMMGSRFTCGVQGHNAKLCPLGTGKGQTHAGKGKGGFGGTGGGSGEGFGGKCCGGKGGGWGGTPMGKRTFGYQGNCFTCGKKNHKAAECRSAPANGTNLVEQLQQIQEVEIEVGSVWQVGNVNRRSQRNWFEVSRVSTHNMSEPIKLELDQNKIPPTENDNLWP